MTDFLSNLDIYKVAICGNCLLDDIHLKDIPMCRI